MSTAERIKGGNSVNSIGGGAISSRRIEVKDAAETVLAETSGSWLEIKQKYSFIVEEAGVIKADFSRCKFEKEQSGNLMLLNFFKDLFNKGFYIKGLYSNLEILNDIYDVKYFKQEDSFVLGTKVDKLSEKDLELYSKPELADQNKLAKYDFLPSQHYDRDKFIANLYKNGIVYGYDKKGIEDGIDHSLSGYKQELELTIAKQKEPVNGEDATIKVVSNKVKQDLRAKLIAEKGVNAKDSIDHFDFANSTCSVESGVKIIQKIPETKGENGRSVTGKVVPNIPGVDKVVLSDMIGEGLEVRTDENGEEFIFTSRAGKLQEDKSTKKYFVTEGYKFNEIDHNHTGDISLVANEDYSIEGDIQQGRKITGTCRYIEIGGDVFGRIEVGGKTEILIKGNLSGKAKIVHNGTGKITIEGKILNGAFLDARKSNLSLGSLEMGTILVNNLQLSNFSVGNIVAKSMDIKNLSTRPNSKAALIGENIYIKDFNSLGTLKLTLMSKFVNSQEKKENYDIEIQKKKEEIKNIILKDFKPIQLNLSNPFLLDSIDSIEPDLEKYIRTSKRKLSLLLLSENKVPEKYKGTVQSLMSLLTKTEQNYTYELRTQLLTTLIKEKLKLIEDAYKKIIDLYKDIDEMKYTIEQINTTGTNSSLIIDRPTSSSAMELYSYETNGKDFYELIDAKELGSLIKGDRVLDGITFSRTNFRLGTAPVKYIVNKKEA